MRNLPAPLTRPIGWTDTILVWIVVGAGMLVVLCLFSCGNVQEAGPRADGGAAGEIPLRAVAGQPGSDAAGSAGAEAAGGVGGQPAGGAGSLAAGGAGGAAGAPVPGGTGGAACSCPAGQFCWRGICACQPANPGTGNVSGGVCGNCAFPSKYCAGACVPLDADPGCV